MEKTGNKNSPISIFQDSLGVPRFTWLAYPFQNHLAHGSIPTRWHLLYIYIDTDHLAPVLRSNFNIILSIILFVKSLQSPSSSSQSSLATWTMIIPADSLPTAQRSKLVFANGLAIILGMDKLTSFLDSCNFTV